MKFDFTDRVAVVTGAGSGIGRAVALELSRLGARVALVDLDLGGLEQTLALMPGEGRSYQVNVAERSEVARLGERIERDFGCASILVNNAGVAMIGTFADTTLEEMEWLFAINFWGVVYCCKFLLPLLRQAPQAHIVNMCSLSALLGLTGQTHYAASKFAVRGFTEALRQELKQTKVHVTSVYPAGIRTQLLSNARVAVAADPTTAIEIKQLFSHLNVITVEFAAQKIVRAIEKRQSRLMIGHHAHGLDMVQRLFPGQAADMITSMLNRVG